MAIVFFNLPIDCISLMSAATANFMQLGLFRDELRQIPSGNFKMDQEIRLIATKNNSSLVADVPPRETSPAVKSEEKRMFSQAKMN